MTAHGWRVAESEAHRRGDALLVYWHHGVKTPFVALASDRPCSPPPGFEMYLRRRGAADAVRTVPIPRPDPTQILHVP